MLVLTLNILIDLLASTIYSNSRELISNTFSKVHVNGYLNYGKKI